MNDFLLQLLKVAQAIGGVIDKGFPVGVNQRTKVATIVAAVAPIAGKIACSVYAPACPIVATVGIVAATLAPAFGFAGLVRADPAK